MTKKYCIDCGKKISPKSKSRCVKCYHKFRKTKISGELNPNWKGGITTLKENCKICNKKLNTTYKSKTGLCNSCRLVNLPMGLKDGKCTKEAKCKDCGTLLYDYRAIRCRPCFYKNLKVIKRKNIKIKPKYSVDWTASLRLSIRQRDNFTCAVCGSVETKVRLHSIHHIDYNKYNCKPSNLITLCSSCHCKTNYNRLAWINYFRDKKYLLYREPKIVYIPGTWDLFHMGHLNLLEKAFNFGDYTIVGVSTNKLIHDYKHIYPIIPYIDRLSVIKSCRYVDLAIKQSKFFDIKQLKPLNITTIILGSDWKNKTFHELTEAKKLLGLDIKYFNYTSTISTTKIKEKIIKNSFDIIKAQLLRENK